MPRFSNKSKKELDSCHLKLQLLFNEIVKDYDCSILEGTRSDSRQNQLFKEGSTKEKAGESKHNYKPSLAIDVSPYPIPKKWGKGEENIKELFRFYHFAGYVKAIANKLDIYIRWGGDWNGNNIFKDQSFDDLIHFELLQNDHLHQHNPQ